MCNLLAKVINILITLIGSVSFLKLFRCSGLVVSNFE